MRFDNIELAPKTRRPLASFRWLASLAVMAIFLVYFFANIQKFKPLLHINGWLLVLIALVDVSIIMANGFFTKLILQPFGKFISIAECFYVSLISSAGNFFAPAGAGFVFRAVYLKKKHGLPYSEYLSILSGNYIIVFLINSFFGLLGLLLLRHKANHQFTVLLVTFATIFVVSAGLTLAKIPAVRAGKTKNKYLRQFISTLRKISEGWNHIISHKKLLLGLSTVTAINLVLTILVTWLIILSLHLHAGFSVLLLFSVLGSLSLFINVTPANLGIKEAIYIFSGSVLGFSVAQIVLIALIDRGVTFLVLAVAWLTSGRRTLAGKIRVNT